MIAHFLSLIKNVNWHVPVSVLYLTIVVNLIDTNVPTHFRSC